MGSMSDSEENPQQAHPASTRVEGDRRQADRRQADRQGKYDRRKNRCIHCLHFQENTEPGNGLCRFHNIPMTAYAFACPHFEAVKKDS